MALFSSSGISTPSSWNISDLSNKHPLDNDKIVKQIGEFNKTFEKIHKMALKVATLYSVTYSISFGPACFETRYFKTEDEAKRFCKIREERWGPGQLDKVQVLVNEKEEFFNLELITQIKFEKLEVDTLEKKR